MPILRSMPLRYTLKKPLLDLDYISPLPQPPPLSPDEAERGHAVHQPLDLEDMADFGDYPAELFQLRAKSIQEHVSSHYPPTYLYVASLTTVLIITVALLVTALALHVSDGKPWVLGAIIILILIFISKMSFLSRIEKAHKDIINLLQSFNDQDMSNYGVLYRVRLSDHQTYIMNSSRFVRYAYSLNLGLPQYTVDLTTINHIDEYSFQDHPATDPHASPDEVLARENELPKYRPKAETSEGEQSGRGQHQQQQGELILGESHPPKYDDVIVEIDQSVVQQSGNGSSHDAMDEHAGSPGPSSSIASSSTSSRA
ncbi:hypothetical protein BGX21_005740 [Mortierella sp. AD011]|nr:hypothetical protein BGX20_004141 [Mortierella sp. AD010]KAF9369949.1 hypothetical protein BGX21_005740 [Mortierella sp. AD011]